MTYFIKVEDGRGLRRKILESSKGSINILRSYQKLFDLRKEKIDLIESLRKDLQELTIFVNRASELMPTLSKAEVKAVEKLDKLPKRKLKPGEKHVYVGRPEKEKKVEVVEAPEELPEVPVEKPKTKAEELHDKLNSIEKKLKKL